VVRFGRRPSTLVGQAAILLGAEPDHRPVAGAKLLKHTGRALRAPGSRGPVDECLGVQQQAAHPQRPRLTLLLDASQLTQLVSTAQRVQRIPEVAIRRLPVMHRDTTEGAQPARIQHRLDSTLVMRGQQCEHVS
jgi:hypothetical protein